MIDSTVYWKKLSVALPLLLGLSMPASGDRLIARSSIDQILPATTSEKQPETEKAYLNPEITGSIQAPFTGDMNLWHFLRQNFELEYSDPDDALVETFETMYGKRNNYLEQVSKRAYWYLPYIVEEIGKRGLPYDFAIIPMLESAFKPTAVSTAKATGLWQFMPSTGKEYGLRQNWWIDERKDFIESTRAALDLLTVLLREFDNDWELALASYNAGEGRVRNAINVNLRANRPATYPHLKLPRETRSYLPKFLAIRNIIADPDKFGVTLHPIPNTATIAVIDAESQTDLTSMASLLSLKPRDLKELNPGYLQGITPPTGPHQIVVPIELASKLEDTVNQGQLEWDVHRVEKGESLSVIAAQYNTNVRILKQLNNLTSDVIFPDQMLQIPIPRIDEGGFPFNLKEGKDPGKGGSSDEKLHSRTAASLVARWDKGGSIFTVGDGIYNVRKNDSPRKIADLFNISLEKLLEMNDLDPSSELVHGQKLIIRKE